MSPVPVAAAAVPLTQGMAALVDVSDYARVAQFKWCATWAQYTFYAVREERGKRVYLHRFIMGAEKGQKVDHRDLDGLNCCRSNLRACTTGQNNCNRKDRRSGSSQYKGVDLRSNGTWRAKIRHNGTSFHLGYFAAEADAARAYDVAAVARFGEFARPNFPAEVRP